VPAKARSTLQAEEEEEESSLYHPTVAALLHDHRGDDTTLINQRLAIEFSDVLYQVRSAGEICHNEISNQKSFLLIRRQRQRLQGELNKLTKEKIVDLDKQLEDEDCSLNFQSFVLMGRGGQGIVYEAYDNVKDCHIALKSIQGADAAAVADAQDEVQILLFLNHPCVIRLLNYGQYSKNTHYGLVFPLAGMDIHKYLELDKDFSVLQMMSILQQILSALSHFNKMLVCHADVKLQNICFENCTNGTCKVVVVDFGAAKMFGAPLVWGSRGSMEEALADELFVAGKKVLADEYLDMYSFGAVMRHLGTRKVGSTTHAAVYYSIMCEKSLLSN